MDKLFITLYVLQLTAADKLAAKVAKVRNRESGQGALEYVGMIAVAAVIVVAVVLAIKSAGIGAWVTGVIDTMKNASNSAPK
jgi:hypothetical protein